MRKIFFILCINLISNTFFAQNNNTPQKVPPQTLVANGGFEEVNTCVEYQMPCGPEGWFPYVGDAMRRRCGLSNPEMFTPYEGKLFELLQNDGKTSFYTWSKLLCPLQANRRYRISVMVRTVEHPFRALTVYFSDKNFYKRVNAIEQLPPSVVLTSRNYSGDTSQFWRRLDLVYTAKGNEIFVALSNPISNYCNVILIDNFSITPMENIEPCPNQYLTLVHLYEQSHRHPFRYVEHQKMALEQIAIKRNNLKVPTLTMPPILPPSSTANPPSLVSKGTTSPQKMVAKADTFTLSGVLFDHDKASIRSNYRIMLDSLAQKLSTQTISKISIIGHTDNNGTENYNQELSKRRAQAVADFLLQNIKNQSITKENFLIEGKGSTQPIAPNKTSEGRQRNRRVEIILQR